MNTKNGNYYGKVSVIVPFYNENKNLLIKCVNSIYNCDGEKEIIVIDDGSNSTECYDELKKLQNKINFKLIRYEKNRGKRYAQYEGFKIAKGEIIVTADSDTIFRKDTIINLIKPFSYKNIGATTGNLFILNRKKNLLTRMISARYWNAFNFERQSQSVLGVITCCTGPVSAYRKELINDILPDYINQTFLGNKCTYGDDRALSTMVLKRNYKIKYVKNAVAYTYAQETIWSFLKQQNRWRKSWIRETYEVSKFMWKKSKALSFEIFITTLLPFFSLFARVMLFVSLILRPSYIFWALPIIFVMINLHSLYLLFNKPSYYIYSVLYGFFHILVVYWTLLTAIFTITKTNWGTR